MNPRVLLVGGTGPTGPGVVVGLIERGYDVTVLHRGVHEVDLPAEVPHIHCDPHDMDSVRAHVDVADYDLVLLMYGRIRRWLSLLEGRVPRVVTVSGTVYDNRRLTSLPIDEAAPQDGENPLFAKLVETEAAFLAAHERGAFEVVQLRYPHLYGPRQLAPREWSIVRRIRDGRRVIPVIDGGLAIQTRAYVDNAVAGLLTVVDSFDAASGDIFHVTDAESLSDRDIVACIAEAMDAEVELVSFPTSTPGAASLWLVGRDIAFSSGSSPELHHSLLDPARITQLGYTPAVSAIDGLRRTVDWLLANPLEPGGDLEAQLGDPFDYPGEDATFRIAADYRRELEAVSPRSTYRHPYPHPREKEAVR